MAKKPESPELVCSFCGRMQQKLVQPPSPIGTSALICSECLELCQQIVEERLGQG